MNKHTTTLTITAAVLVITTMTTAAHADHENNHIWIETAEGNFTTASNKAQDHIDKNYADEYNIFSHDKCDIPYVNFGDESRPETTRINEYLVINQRKGECGDKQAEENRLNIIMEPRTSKAPTTELHQEYHECVCGYWYQNTVKDEYTYTILDLPKDREIPSNYKDIVAAGVQAGLDRWGNINNIEFTETDSRLKANIIIQQQIGNGRTYGNAEIGCLFDNNQCTIQLFTDVNVRNEQTLQNTQSIEWITAHEFGHLIGLPHHIDPDHIMNTIHADDVRTYYEARNINVPKMTEPTHEQRLLGYEDPTQTTEDKTPPTIHEIGVTYSEETGLVKTWKTETRDVVTWTEKAETISLNGIDINKHETVIEFVELIKSILQSAPGDDLFDIYMILQSIIHDIYFEIAIENYRTNN